MSQPQVTVVIPVHDHMDWVFEAVESAARQDYRPLRIVVVDDGSTDGSADAVARQLYRPKGPSQQGEPWACLGQLTKWKVDVLVHRFKDARGPSFARNWGMKAAWEGTDVFAFLDSDDLYEPGKISKSVARFLDAPGLVGAVYSDYDTLRPDGLRVREWKEPYSRQRLLQECIVNCDSLVSKEAIDAVGGFDDTLRVVEDYDLWLRLSEKFLISHVPESLVTVRVGEHSSTSRVQTETWRRCYARVFEKLRERAA